MINRSVPSPCVRNCCLNEEDVCLGCFRTLNEIIGWSESNNETRLIILQKAEKRQQLSPGINFPAQY
jgi:predicted Fe-S protein YdhL (DUF1289 family)